ncbi:type 1 glutamine amidotransferase [Patescibacteria group bacterium AH-259-L05]|nr:type 1 glutamine amidotransferase [Patescibacteria group bacterium AH-259-L05]
MKNNKKLQLLFLDILTDNLESKKQEEKVTKGPYAELFRKKLNLKKDEFITVDAAQKQLPDPKKYHGIIIGGSAKHPIPSDENHWMKNVYKFINTAINTHIPLLGVCGGHQFIARALGGTVIYNPQGREFGTIPLTLTKNGTKDLLFKGVPENFFVQSSHKCMVKNINTKGKLLASSDLCEIQSLAINSYTRTVQFHPELSYHHMTTKTKQYKQGLIKEGFVNNENEFKKLLLSIKKTGQTEKILLNFLNYFVLPNKK